MALVVCLQVLLRLNRGLSTTIAWVPGMRPYSTCFHNFILILLRALKLLQLKVSGFLA